MTTSAPNSTSVAGWRSTLLLILGCATVVWLVLRENPRELWRALQQARSALPMLAALEALMLVTDTVAYAMLLAPEGRTMPLRGWQRSAAGSYVCLVLLPAGRAIGEAARAAFATPYVGAKRAITASADLQVVALFADGVVSAVAAAVVFTTLGRTQHLALVLAANAILVTGAAAVLALLLRRADLRMKLVKMFPRSVTFLPDRAPSAPGSRRAALLWSLVGRGLQVVQYGLAVAAVGGAFSLESMFAAHGIHSIAATVGVAMPNQLGVADGAYVAFARVLGFANAPARALAVVTAVRLAQLLLVLPCLLLTALAREPLSKGARG